ncbi:hypothetical protein R5W24_005693 [Gemmata sp. JC717]|uniref:hypothetical protein n=1 Tax=Gemmata algarum TaxID=2975278 RepID=UPI0021BB72E8|nr:hypothetical protein [Gemmata algarum]MDY3556527.1 hypothetical protein [Gemmata algarum]
MGDRLFVMQVVVAVEDQWFAPGTDGPPVRSERRYRIDAQLFAAPDVEAAYRTAVAWLPGFSDTNHDGPGDLTRMFAVGLHQLEEVLPRRCELAAAVGEPYGVDVGGYDPSDADADGVPRLLDRNELEVFRAMRLLRPHTEATDAEPGDGPDATD